MTAKKGDKHPKMIGNKYALGNKGGRPRCYELEELPALGEMMVNWFQEKLDIFKKDIREKKKDEVKVFMPLFSDFEREIAKCSWNALNDYCEQDKEFSRKYEECKAIQKAYLSLAGQNNITNPTFAIFAAVNYSDMKNKQDTDITSGNKPLQTVLVRFIDGKDN